MPLLDLSAEEVAFLAQPLPAQLASHPDGAGVGSAHHCADDFAARLGQGLALTLGARLRLPLMLVPCSYEATPGMRPHWRVSPALAGLWLARRQGMDARSVHPAMPGWQGGAHVPRALLHTLDAVLAERWLDAPATLPGGLAWRLAASDTDIILALDLPASAAGMQRWAREIIAS